MFLFEPERSQFDLQWRMFGIPVRVHPMFWLVSALLGWSLTRLPNGMQLLLLWIGCVFISILIHELGHVLIGVCFGAYGHIVLYSFGGLAIGSNNLPSRWQRIAVLFAGPCAGFIFFGFVWLLLVNVEPDNLPEMVFAAMDFLFQINLFWGILNLLPIWPLDGGQISREFLGWLAPRRGVQIALGISIVFAGLLAAQALSVHLKQPLIPFLRWGSLYSALFFALLAFGSYQALQQHDANQRRWRRDPWERDPDYWKK